MNLIFWNTYFDFLNIKIAKRIYWAYYYSNLLSYRYMEAAPQLFLQMYIAYRSESATEGIWNYGIKAYLFKSKL